MTDPKALAGPESMDALALRHGTDKGSQRHDFARVYDSFLSQWREQPVRVVELGVYEGASLRMWRDYFPRGEVYGVDISPGAMKYAGDRMHVYIGDQKSPEVLDRVLADSGPIDLVVDDGSHRYTEQQGTLTYLWPHLKPGGVYIMEDIHTSYIERWGMTYRAEETTVELLKQIIDDIHVATHKQSPVLGGVKSMHFYFETCVICKRD